ncbi:MAG: hypothetical protein IT572_08365, partial [Deltaproteobacteria bacterium]|nr:hypothetical protein [Deltaproteobacteria bacterium]
ADFIIEIYAMESALLRSLQLIKQQGEEKSRIPIAITKIYVTEKCMELANMARQFCANVAKGDDAAYEKYDKAIGRILDVKPIDTLNLRLQIAQHAIESDGYAI